MSAVERSQADQSASVETATGSRKGTTNGCVRSARESGRLSRVASSSTGRHASAARRTGSSVRTSIGVLDVAGRGTVASRVRLRIHTVGAHSKTSIPPNPTTFVRGGRKTVRTNCRLLHRTLLYQSKNSRAIGGVLRSSWSSTATSRRGCRPSGDQSSAGSTRSAKTHSCLGP